LWLLPLLLLAFGLTGCSDDDPASPAAAPDPRTAASLAAGVQGPANVGATMTDLEMFQNPLGDMIDDAGIGDDTPLGEGWDDGGVSYDFPDKALMAADAVRSLMRTNETAATAVAPGGAKSSLERRYLQIGRAKAAGDTIAALYFDSSDSTGLDALVETDDPDIVRLVSQRTYPDARLLQIAERASEIVIDTNGTLDNGADDAYHRIGHGFTRGNGEITTGVLEPVSGDGPIAPGVAVRGYHSVENPSFHPLQAWNEAEIVLDPGAFEVDGDETLHSMTATVHWRNDAEHTLTLAPVAGGAIEPDTDLRVVGAFTAAPENRWLESTADTLLVRMGDLDDETDDELDQVSRFEVFDGTAADGGSPRNWIRLTPDRPVIAGDEPCGGLAQQDVHYPAEWWLVHLNRTADIDCDGSGSLTLLMEFRDGTSTTRVITWDGAGAAATTENRADGTVVAGTFNESTGAYSLLTTFPVGHDPVSRDRHGVATEGSVEAWDITTWLDGHDDETYFQAVEGVDSETVTGYRIDGGLREDFTLTSHDDGDVNGSWSNNDGARGEFDVEMLEGGGHLLTFAASEPNAAGGPSVTGEVYYAPDGSGTGTITFTQYGDSVTFTVNFGPDGTGTLVDGQGNEVLL